MGLGTADRGMGAAKRTACMSPFSKMKRARFPPMKKRPNIGSNSPVLTPTTSSISGERIISGKWPIPVPADQTQRSTSIWGQTTENLTYLKNGQLDLDGPRFLELWNLVFIQYNRTSPTHSRAAARHPCGYRHGL